MTQRKSMKDLDPKAYEPMMAMDKYISESGLDKRHWELIKIRVSQNNGCAYCLDKHTRDSITIGESQQRINVLSAWHETNFFTREEQVILKLAEEMTLIAGKGVSNETYNNALEVLGDKKMAAVMMAIISINGWNRIGITTHLQPALSVKAA